MNGKLKYQLDFIEVTGVKCACGCGMEAAQIYKGIPIPDKNPITHYRAYQQRMEDQVVQWLDNENITA